MSISRRGERREAETCIQLLQGGGLSLQTAESPTRVTHGLFRPFASAAPRQLAPLICLVNTGRIKKKSWFRLTPFSWERLSLILCCSPQLSPSTVFMCLLLLDFMINLFRMLVGKKWAILLEPKVN